MYNEVLFYFAGEGGLVMLGLISSLTAAKTGSILLHTIGGIGSAIRLVSFVKDIIDD